MGSSAMESSSGSCLIPSGLVLKCLEVGDPRSMRPKGKLLGNSILREVQGGAGALSAVTGHADRARQGGEQTQTMKYLGPWQSRGVSRSGGLPRWSGRVVGEGLSTERSVQVNLRQESAEGSGWLEAPRLVCTPVAPAKGCSFVILRRTRLHHSCISQHQALFLSEIKQQPTCHSQLWTIIL